MKKLIALILALVCLCSAASAEMASLSVDELPAGVHALPIDFSPGKVPQESCFSTDRWYYSDPSITVSIETGREAGCDYWIATITIADPSQLRTVSAGGFDTADTAKGTLLAQSVNAVLAIAGDYYTDTGMGLILRQGTIYKNALETKTDRRRDILTIDANGDFHVYYLPGQDEVPTEVNGVPVINAFYFGPVLVDQGQVIPNVNINRVTRDTMVAEKKRQRVAICQVGPLSYKIIMCGPPARGNAGMTLQQFADLVVRQDVQIAYNMDGGDSAMMIFNGVKLNDVRSTSVRNIEDIIYFASAYDPQEVQ